MNTIWLGVTGNIGTGKSTACKILEDLGAGIVDADAEAHKMAIEDAIYRSQLSDRFGEGLFLSNGDLNRSVLASNLFQDPVALSDFNSIVAPRLVARTRKYMTLLSETHKVVVLDGALIFEYGREGDYDEVWLITSNDQVSTKRLVEKGLSLEQIEKRRSAQWSQSAKKALASRVIINDLTVDHLRKQILLAWSEILKL